MIMKTAIYCRVSTSTQELDNQLIQLRDYCKKSNWEIYKEYKDIISGTKISRPAFDDLFTDAHKKLFNIVVFWDLSRFSRSGTLYTLQKLKELDNLGIKWHSYQEPYFSTLGDFKDVVISIMSTIAKIEREKISERTKAGLLRTDKKLGRPKIPNDAVKQALITMYKNKIKRIPIQDPETNELIGIITTYDIIAAFNSLELKMTRE